MLDRGARGRDGQGARDRVHGAMNVFGNAMAAAANVLSLDQQELRTSLQQGKSLAQIAAGRGISRDQLKAGMMAQLQTQIQQAQTTGRLNQEQASRLLQSLSQHIDQVIDRVGGQGPALNRGGPSGDRPGPRGPN
jgi:hypothetical protein